MGDVLWYGNDGTTPNSYSVAGNWSGAAVPTTADHVRFLPTSNQACTAGLNQSAVAIGDFIVEGFTKAIGLENTDQLPTYLQIDPNYFEFDSTGKSFIDIGAAAIDAIIKGTASASGANFGLYLKGTAISDLSVTGGSVGLAILHGESATCTRARVAGSGATLHVGQGTTLTTASVVQGELVLRCASSGTVSVHSGTLRTEEVGTQTLIEIFDGEAILNSSGTITTLDAIGGVIDFTQSQVPRTVTNLNIYPGAVIKFDADVMTFTNTTHYGAKEASYNPLS